MAFTAHIDIRKMASGGKTEPHSQPIFMNKYVTGPAPRMAWFSQGRVSSPAERAHTHTPSYTTSISNCSRRSSFSNLMRTLKSTNFVIQSSKSTQNPIQLTSYSVEPRTGMFRGTLRIAKDNIETIKSAFVRYSIDGWKSFHDVEGVLVADDLDANFYFFTIETGAWTMEQPPSLTSERFILDLDEEKHVSFAIGYHTENVENHWENNNGQNFQATIGTNASLSPKGQALYKRDTQNTKQVMMPVC